MEYKKKLLAKVKHYTSNNKWMNEKSALVINNLGRLYPIHKQCQYISIRKIKHPNKSPNLQRSIADTMNNVKCTGFVGCSDLLYETLIISSNVNRTFGLIKIVFYVMKGAYHGLDRPYFFNMGVQ